MENARDGKSHVKLFATTSLPTPVFAVVSSRVREKIESLRALSGIACTAKILVAVLQLQNETQCWVALH
jgi:hypothetical protein